MPSPGDPSLRRGAALIIAILILTALLLMGLPFLFSQSASLHGTRSLAASQAAQLYANSARNLAIAVGVYTTERHLRERALTDPGEPWTALAPALAGFDRGYGPLSVSATTTRVGLRLAALDPAWNAPGGRTLVGAALEDEQGKLNANALGPQGWHDLLAVLQIRDWDDGEVPEQQRVDADYTVDAGPTSNPPPSRPHKIVGSRYRVADNDAGEIGELAEAIVDYRLATLKRPFRTLEELLGADPKYNASTTTNIFRKPLTRAELERLRPHLSFNSLGQGRSGLSDLATVAATDQPPHDHHIFLDGGGQVVALGTWLLGTPTGAPPRGLDGVMVSTGSGSTNQGTVLAGGGLKSLGASGDPLWLQLPPTVNLHEATAPVRDWYRTLPIPSGSPITTYAGLGDVLDDGGNDLLWRLRPRSAAQGSPIYERPPLDIASLGMFRLFTDAVILDQAGKQVAQQSRSSVVQALPQETQVERRWTSQGEMEALVKARHGSHVQTWPRAVDRVPSLKPDDHPLPTTAPAAVQALAAAPIGNLATLEQVPAQIPRDWRAPCGADKPTERDRLLEGRLASGATQAALAPADTTLPDLVSDPYLGDDLRPDGIHLRTTRGLGWPIEGQAGAWGVNNDPPDLRERHLSLWFKADEHWSGVVPIWEVTPPIGGIRVPGLGLSATGATRVEGDPALENQLGLYADVDKGLLVLAIAPPGVEQLDNLGPSIGVDDPTTPDFDERCLAGPVPLAPCGATTASITSLLKANRIVHCFKVDSSFFDQRLWHHVQVSITAFRPGGIALIVDGQVGRDVGATGGDLSLFGDHCTLPALPLVGSNGSAGLPLVTPSNGKDLFFGATTLASSTLTVLPVAGLNADQLYPQAGFLLIDDEYIRYNGILNGNIFQNCVRGQRQNSQTDEATLSYRWPATQTHQAYTPVMPGGYRVRCAQNATFYAGGCSLAVPMPPGDPALACPSATKPYPVGIWAKIDTAAGAPNIEPDLGAPPYMWLRAAPHTLILTGGVVGQFPPTGIVRVVKNGGTYGYWFYKSTSGTDPLTLNGLTSVQATLPGPDPMAPGPRPPHPGPTDLFSAEPDDIRFNPNDLDDIPNVMLVSMQLSGLDALEANRYKTATRVGNDTLFNGTWLVQVAASNRVEWLGYQHIAQSADKSLQFLIHRDGWFSRADHSNKASRGVYRTGHAGLTASDDLPAGAIVTPVQMEFTGSSYAFATGDVVTAVPPQMGNTRRASQFVVRFGATDGYDLTADSQDPANDTKNGYFAVWETAPGAGAPQPDPAVLGIGNCTDWEFICGPGWGPRDNLTPGYPRYCSSSPLLAYAPPRADAQVDGYWDASQRPLLGLGTSQLATAQEITIDALMAGVPGSSNAPSQADPLRVIAWSFKSSPADTFLDSSSSLDGGVQVTVNRNIFSTSTSPTSSPLSLLRINGEAFVALAAGPGNPVNTAWLIARAQLGSQAAPHYVGEAVEVLPIGPIGQLLANNVTSASGTIPAPYSTETDAGANLGQPAGAWFTIQAQGNRLAGNEFIAPCLLVHSATSGAAFEVISAVNNMLRGSANPAASDYNADRDKWLTRPWMRGLYGTAQGDWSGQASTPADPSYPTITPIVYGWWPRFASPLPTSDQENLLDPDDRARLRRSRIYAWAGFPARFHGMRLAALDDAFYIEHLDLPAWLRGDLRALPGGDHRFVPWSAVPTTGILSLGPGQAGAIFDTDYFKLNGKPATVDGVEVRLTWRCSDPAASLDQLARHSNATPRIGPVRLRCWAPSALISNLEAR